MPLARVASITASTGADSRTVRIRVRGVITSEAVLSPKLSERQQRRGLLSERAC